MVVLNTDLMHSQVNIDFIANLAKIAKKNLHKKLVFYPPAPLQSRFRSLKLVWQNPNYFYLPYIWAPSAVSENVPKTRKPFSLTPRSWCVSGCCL